MALGTKSQSLRAGKPLRNALKKGDLWWAQGTSQRGKLPGSTHGTGLGSRLAPVFYDVNARSAVARLVWAVHCDGLQLGAKPARAQGSIRFVAPHIRPGNDGS